MLGLWYQPEVSSPHPFRIQGGGWSELDTRHRTKDGHTQILFLKFDGWAVQIFGVSGERVSHIQGGYPT